MWLNSHAALAHSLTASFPHDAAAVPAHRLHSGHGGVVDRDVFFRQLMVYGAIVTVVAPVVVWFLFVVL